MSPNKFKQREEIFKIQISLIPDDAMALIYNKGKKAIWEQVNTAKIKRLMKGRVKAYFYGYLDAERRIVISREAPAQSW